MSRRKAREVALQVLYQIDLTSVDPVHAVGQAFHREDEGHSESEHFTENDKTYVHRLVHGAWDSRAESDGLIATYARQWSLERMSAVDRNIMRLAIYEILRSDDVPSGAAVDEAVELAKKFSGTESGKFVNGILRSVVRGLNQEAPSEKPSVPGN